MKIEKDLEVVEYQYLQIADVVLLHYSIMINEKKLAEIDMKPTSRPGKRSRISLSSLQAVIMGGLPSSNQWDASRVLAYYRNPLGSFTSVVLLASISIRPVGCWSFPLPGPRFMNVKGDSVHRALVTGIGIMVY